jgi:hypothetical protein
MKPAQVLAIAFLFVPIFICPSARGEDGRTETAQLRAIQVKLYGEDIYVRIWQDAFQKIMDLRKQFSGKTKRPPRVTAEVFTATFTAPEGEVVMAATATPKADCESYTNVGLSPSLIACPLRVALVQGSTFKIIYESDSFPFSIGVTDSGELNNEDKQNYTTIIFDPAKKTLRTELVEGGVHKLQPDSSDSSIQLTY